jgi:hypothetical protein
MDLDKEMELLMTGKVVEPEPRKRVFAYEIGDDNRGTYVIRIDGEILLFTVFVLYGMFLGAVLRRG